jgi:hypothetical protein
MNRVERFKTKSPECTTKILLTYKRKKWRKKKQKNIAGRERK